MNAYGTVLKQLIQLTGSKLSTISDVIGYDVSYISKWCNKSMLPAAKMAPEINRSMASLFAQEILSQENIKDFEKAFSMEVCPDGLENAVYHLLKENYSNSCNEASTELKQQTTYKPRILTLANDIYNFFNHELPQMLLDYDESLDVLCTLDVCRFALDSPSNAYSHLTPKHPVNVKIGVDTTLLYDDNNQGLEALYYFINAHKAINFDFYDNTLMRTLNTIVVKDHVAILCALDQYNRVNVASVIFDPEKVNQIYVRTLPSFRTPNLLAHATEQLEFYQHGYRTDFYTKDNFQFLLTLGFEYLLPQECWDKIIQTARERDKDEFMALIVAQLQITWEEIFEKNTLDFYVLKSSLMKYIDDGEIIFADVVYHMTPEERKLHIENVLALAKGNPNIHFYVIDDEQLVNTQHLIHFAIFNNRKKLFLKNPERYHTDVGPYFYSVLSDTLVQKISAYLDSIRTADYCIHYDAESLQAFYDKYGSLVYRMIDLSAFKK
ncbi:hypothetical protein [Coprococcus catus]|uniref:hypothetical protein n=1 Tax=Coprococcus catus TaxID=116085 RepID=UPI001C8BB271|nr:hypothetical protein [Coprococcus catus]MBX9231538.1 hypothetical protein [Coprococcus catus]MCT6800433.1 hypothetical protein [Coprococcus catus]